VTTIEAVTIVPASSTGKLPVSVARLMMEPNPIVVLAMKPEVLCDEAGIPYSARCGHEPSDQIGKDSRQNQLAPTLDCTEAKHVANLLEIGRMADAPTLTLKKMYHCVPSSSRMIEPTPRPPPMCIKPAARRGTGPWQAPMPQFERWAPRSMSLNAARDTLATMRPIFITAYITPNTMTTARTRETNFLH
jgi:hypothetical protein